MICPACAAAADILDAPALPGAAAELATKWHADCRGPGSCACQHRVPSIDELRARRAAAPRGGLARMVRLLAYA